MMCFGMKYYLMQQVQVNLKKEQKIKFSMEHHLHLVFLY